MDESTAKFRIDVKIKAIQNEEFLETCELNAAIKCELDLGKVSKVSSKLSVNFSKPLLV